MANSFYIGMQESLDELEKEIGKKTEELTEKIAPFIIHLTVGTSNTLDKKFSEIKEAIEAEKDVIVIGADKRFYLTAFSSTAIEFSCASFAVNASNKSFLSVTKVTVTNGDVVSVATVTADPATA